MKIQALDNMKHSDFWPLLQAGEYRRKCSLIFQHRAYTCFLRCPSLHWGNLLVIIKKTVFRHLLVYELCHNTSSAPTPPPLPSDTHILGHRQQPFSSYLPSLSLLYSADRSHQRSLKNQEIRRLWWSEIWWHCVIIKVNLCIWRIRIDVCCCFYILAMRWRLYWMLSK